MGSVVISLDGELGWGRHLGVPSASFVRHARQNWDRLLALFEEFDVPATWAVVGHLFLSECERPHLDHPGGERCCERSTDDVAPEEIWFGPDLLEAVRTSDVDHELAGHGFTHWRFDHEEMTGAIAARELRQCVAAASDRGIDFSSFVFPVNRVRYKGLLPEYGFDCYRGPNPRYATRTALQRRVEKMRDAFVRATPPPIVEPVIEEYGLVNVPASLYLFGFEGPARSVAASVRRDPVVAKAKRGIDAAADSDGVFHMWLHPHDLAEDRTAGRMRPILSYLRQQADATNLRIETMGAVASRTLDERPHDVQLDPRMGSQSRTRSSPRGSDRT